MEESQQNKSRHRDGDGLTSDVHTDTKKVTQMNLFDEKAAALLQGLTLSTCQPDYDLLVDLQESAEPVSAWQQAADSQMMYTVSNKMMCSLCDCQFDNREQQKEHYKLDWHRFNLKQRIMGAESVTIETFETMSGDISSISGSDSNTSDSDNEDHLAPYTVQSKIDSGQKQIHGRPEVNYDNEDDDYVNKGRVKHRRVKQRSYPRVFFASAEGQLISLHRCILHGKKNIPGSQSELISMASKLSQKPKWAIIMTGGGHFAGAVFHGNEIIVHKTFHRYTVRAKRGTAQGMRDGQQGGNQPKSAGSSLRRYNEAALVQDIQDLLETWKDNLRECQLIFLRAPSYNRNIFFGGKKPAFSKDDARRMSSIPFPTRRATLKELKRIHDVLSSVECYGEAKEAEARLNNMFSAKATSKSPKKDTDVLKQKEKTKEKSKDIDKLAEGNKEPNSEEGDDDDIEFNLVYEEEEISTSHLKEFDCTKKPRRKRRKPKSKLNGNGLEGDQLTNDLYTVCKTGNTSKLETLLNEIAKTQLEHLNDKETINTSNVSSSSALTDQESKLNQVAPILNEDARENDIQHNLSNQADNSCSTCQLETTEDCVANEDRTNCKLENEISNNGDISIVENAGEPVLDRLNVAIDVKGSTLLHVAAEAGQRSALWLLLEAGADPSVRNKGSQPPYVVSANKEIRNEFRRFMAAYPDKYDYVTAQIPSPLTADMEEERANKANEKKKAQKKTKRTKQKEKTEEEKKKMAEKKEKAWFTALSDREKRALAAENRLAKQATTTESNRLRCWLCGEDMTGKVPFEYMDFKFCSIKCLKQHKQQQQYAPR